MDTEIEDDEESDDAASDNLTKDKPRVFVAMGK